MRCDVQNCWQTFLDVWPEVTDLDHVPLDERELRLYVTADPGKLACEVVAARSVVAGAGENAGAA
jgi:hypothetical protein